MTWAWLTPLGSVQAVIAADTATFSTPFAALGVPAEGCSSHHFPIILGDVGAQRMLGKEGWQPGADEAKAAGLIEHVAPAERLLEVRQLPSFILGISYCSQPCATPHVTYST